MKNLEVIILEKKLDILKAKNLGHFFHFMLTVGCEGAYNCFRDSVLLKLYNLENDIDSKKFYGIGVLMHELKHREDVMLDNEIAEEPADDYAISFLNNNSILLKDILKLKHTWKVKEF
jgi:hypothetical protein